MGHIILSLLLCVSATIGKVIYVQSEKTVKYNKLKQYPFWMFSLRLFSWSYLVMASLFYTMHTPSIKIFIITFGLGVSLIPILVIAELIINDFMERHYLTMEYREYKNLLSKHYSKDLVELIIKVIILVKKEGLIHRLSNDLSFEVGFNRNESKYYYRKSYQMLGKIKNFLNLTFSSTNDKYRADLITSILLEDNHIANLSVLINVLEDERKRSFILSEEGSNQALRIAEDFEDMNRVIIQKTSEMSELVRKTSANEINYEIEKLRANSFKDINKIK